MKSNPLKLTLCAAVLLTVGFTTEAAPLQRADVSTNLAWVAHLDFDGLRPTAIGQYLLAQADQPEAADKLAAFQAMFGIDLRKQLHGVTLYGPDAKPEDGVLLLYADFDLGRLVTLAKGAKDYQSTNYNQHVIHSWIDDSKGKRHGVKPRTYAAIQGARVIFGQNQAAVAGALDVLDGAVPSLAGNALFPQLGAGAANFIQAAARKLDVPGGDPNAAILKLSKTIRLDIGDAQQQVTAALSLEADDSEVANHLFSIAQGLVALVKLQSAKPESVKVAQALTLKQDGTSLIATLAMADGDVIQLLSAQSGRKAHKKKTTNDQ